MFGTLAALAALAQMPHRWFYVQTNLLRPEAVVSTIALIHRAAKAGYNGMLLADSKLQNQNPFPNSYRDGMRKLLQVAAADGVEVIPSVLPVGYADGMLSQNPSLIESMPCRHVELKAKGGFLKSNDDELYPDGGFEQAKTDAVTGTVFQDGPGVTSFLDTKVAHSGGQSLRIDHPALLPNGNCRIVKKISLEPWHQYRLTVWVRTQNFDQAGDVNAAILTSSGKSLSYNSLGVAPTQEWTQEVVVFNSQNNSSALVYLGVWGGNTGQLWFDDISLKHVGLLNVDRRTACPVRLTDAQGGSLAEGEDYEPIADSKFGTIPWPGEFDFKHEMPPIKLLPGSRITNGSTVYADFFAAASTDDGKTSICLADPATEQLERQEIDRVDELCHARGYLLSQDEMRVQGWCGACEASGKTSGQLIAQDIKRSTGMLHGKQAYVWSDMFDPFHNAVDEYYLCRGSIKGSWEGLQPGTIVLNWNSGHQKESLGFFAGRGFRQILAGYYDADPAAIKPWIERAREAGGFDGVMYTTWQGKYDDLEAFAKAAWGGGSTDTAQRGSSPDTHPPKRPPASIP